MKNTLFIIWLILLFSCSCQPKQSSNYSDFDSDTLNLVWADEFEIEGAPDSTKWVYDIGDTCDKPFGCGWGNNELQYYTSETKNVNVADGNLTITLRADSIGRTGYTSARIKTKGNGDWIYGRIVTRAKLPKGLGVWPAIWMLPSEKIYGGWPNGGEIDIMENVGYDPDAIVATAHTGSFNHMIGTHKNGQIIVPDNGEVFHDYILEWDKDQYSCYVDNRHVFTYKNDHTGFKSWPFDQPFHLIINLAFGGNWGGKNGVDPSILPATFEIDYVRVYQ